MDVPTLPEHLSPADLMLRFLDLEERCGLRAQLGLPWMSPLLLSCCPGAVESSGPAQAPGPWEGGGGTGAVLPQLGSFPPPLNSSASCRATAQGLLGGERGWEGRGQSRAHCSGSSCACAHSLSKALQRPRGAGTASPIHNWWGGPGWTVPPRKRPRRDPWRGSGETGLGSV